MAAQTKTMVTTVSFQYQSLHILFTRTLYQVSKMLDTKFLPGPSNSKRGPLNIAWISHHTGKALHYRLQQRQKRNSSRWRSRTKRILSQLRWACSFSLQTAQKRKKWVLKSLRTVLLLLTRFWFRRSSYHFSKSFSAVIRPQMYFDMRKRNSKMCFSPRQHHSRSTHLSWILKSKF